MTDITVVSVKHTGSKFLSKLLCCDFTHYHGKPHGNIASPIRDPYLVYQTWYSRRKLNLDDMWKEWDIFNRTFLRQKVWVVSVDKHIGLEELSNHIGRKLETDWEPVGSLKRIQAPEIDLSPIYNLEVVKRYGYGI